MHQSGAGGPRKSAGRPLESRRPRPAELPEVPCTTASRRRAASRWGRRATPIYSLPALAKRFPKVKKLPYSLRILLENLLRHEDGRSVHAADIEALADARRQDADGPRDRLPPGARPPAGLHGRPGGRRPRRDARGARADGREPREDQPARAGRPRHRPLGHRRPVRARRRRSARTRSSSSSGTGSATPSSAGARTPSGTSASSRRTPASATR